MNKERLRRRFRFFYNVVRIKKDGEAMKAVIMAGILLTSVLMFGGCGFGSADKAEKEKEEMQTELFTRNTKIETVANDPVFENYGRLIFPVEKY